MREAGEGAGNNGPSHGERQHGIDNKHDEQEEGHLETGNRKKLIGIGPNLSKINQSAFFLLTAFRKSIRQ